MAQMNVFDEVKAIWEAINKVKDDIGGIDLSGLEKRVDAVETKMKDLEQAISNVKGMNLYDTVQNMLADSKLIEGDIAFTMGYYQRGDGGGAVYRIEKEQAGTDTGPTWSLKLNGKALYANIQNTDYVTYKMFGAPLDGVQDDGPAMRLCHRYAHTIYKKDQTGRIFEYTCWVKQNGGIINKKDAQSIDVYTNMDLSGSTLMLTDENATWFGIYVWGDVNSVYFDFEFTEEQKAYLKEGSYYFPMLDNSIPANIAILLDEEPYSARDDVGYSYTVGRKELLIHDMHGICASPLSSDWTKAGGREIRCPVTNVETGVTTVESFTSKFKTSFTHIPNQHLTFIGCDVMLNISNDTYMSVLWVKRHNCTVKDFVLRPHRDSLRNTVFKNAMIYLWDSYNVTVENINGFNGAGRDNHDTGFIATSGYMLRMSNCANVTVRNCRLLGYWGATAMNSTKNVRFEKCELNRIDSHDYISNIFVHDCVLYNHGLQIGHGSGIMSVTDCTMYVAPYKDVSYTNHLIELNLTYGRIFTGKMYFNNIKIIATDGTPEFALVQATFWPNAVNITEKFSMPEITLQNIQVDLTNRDTLVYLMFGGSRNVATSDTPPRHIKNIAIDNTVRWKYVGRSVSWAPGIGVTVDQLIKVPVGTGYRYYICTGAGNCGSTAPTALTGTIISGTATLRALGTDIGWKARYNYGVDDVIDVEVGVSYASKVYKCVQAGTSNGNMPIHTSGTAVDNEVTWQYIAKTSAWTKTWKANTAFNVGDVILTSRNLYRCVKAGTTGAEIPTSRGWFQNYLDGTVTWQYIGGNWEPHMWFDVASYCNARGNIYQVVGNYGSTSGDLPVENSGTANDGDVIWLDMGDFQDTVPTWQAGQSYAQGTQLHTATDVYNVVGGLSGVGNPQFTSGTGMDGTLVAQFVGFTDVWKPSTAYKVGDYVNDSIKIYRCVQAGISAPSGWGPTVEEGTVEDGTVIWQTVTAKGVFRRDNQPYPQGQYMIAAGVRLYVVIPGTAGTIAPTHKSGIAVNGTLQLEWASTMESYAAWQPETFYEVGTEVTINGRLYKCIANGVLESSRRIMFDNIDTSATNVQAIKFKEGTNVRTSLKNGRLEVIARDCYGVDTPPADLDWFGRSDNPQPTKFAIK